MDLYSHGLWSSKGQKGAAVRSRQDCKEVYALEEIVRWSLQAVVVCKLVLLEEEESGYFQDSMNHPKREEAKENNHHDNRARNSSLAELLLRNLVLELDLNQNKGTGKSSDRLLHHHLGIKFDSRLVKELRSDDADIER